MTRGDAHQRCLQPYNQSGDTHLQMALDMLTTCNQEANIGNVNEYPSMHCFGIQRHTQSMIAYKILTEYFWKVR